MIEEIIVLSTLPCFRYHCVCMYY